MVRTPDPTRQSDAERSDAQLDMLHSFAAKLNVLTDTAEIGNTITAELRTIVAVSYTHLTLPTTERV